VIQDTDEDDDEAMAARTSNRKMDFFTDFVLRMAK
jgi:hypothetical protein